MILEVAILDVIPGQEAEFQVAFAKASPIIVSMVGYVSHQLQRCVEKQSRYILLVNWETLEAHTVGFRGSEQYQEWKKMLHHFYDPFPTVEHYELVQDYPGETTAATRDSRCIVVSSRNRFERLSLSLKQRASFVMVRKPQVFRNNPDR
jgi:heme-degrading monooxygenase HmoA